MSRFFTSLSPSLQHDKISHLMRGHFCLYLKFPVSMAENWSEPTEIPIIRRKYEASIIIFLAFGRVQT